MVDTWAEVSVLGRKFYNKLECKPPSRNISLCYKPEVEPTNELREKFDAGTFDISMGQHTHLVDQYVAPFRDSMLLGIGMLKDHKSSWT